MNLSSKLFFSVAACSLLFVACGSDGTAPADSLDTSNANNEEYEEPEIKQFNAVGSSAELPACDSELNGKSIFIYSENIPYICSNGTWISTNDANYKIDCENGFLKAVPNTNPPESPASKNIKGLAQKGPFYFGASVTIAELDTTQNLNQTGNVIKGCITSNDGSFSIENTLANPYALVTVNGFYRNEVNSRESTEPISLKAIVDLGDSSIRINSLSHLEAGRVQQLIAQSGGYMKLSEAKQQAKTDVLKAFGIDVTNLDLSHDASIFDNNENAAVLAALSIMLQYGKRTPSEIENMLNSIAEDIKGDGAWNNESDKAKIADWVMAQDTSWKVNDFRNNMGNWGLGQVNGFEKYLRDFWTSVYRLGECSEVTAGSVKHVENNASANFASYYEHEISDLRFICDWNERRWRPARGIEKDTVGFGPGEYDREIREGKINHDAFYIFEVANGTWREATPEEADGFTDIAEIYNSLAADETVVFVVRHAKRTDDTSKKGHLTDEGVKQAQSVGAKLKSGPDFFFMASEYLRAQETCSNIASGRGQNVSIPENAVLNGSWYVKDNALFEKYNSTNGGGWNVYSDYAFYGMYEDTFYDLEERSLSLETELLKNVPAGTKASVMCSHDYLVLPFLAYFSEGHANVRYSKTGRWLNYLSGLAIVTNGKGEKTYIPVKGLETGIMR